MNAIQSLFPSIIITIYWASKQRVCVKLARETGRSPLAILQTLFPKPSPLVSSLSLKQNTSCSLPSPLPTTPGDATDHPLLTSLFKLFAVSESPTQSIPPSNSRPLHLRATSRLKADPYLSTAPEI